METHARQRQRDHGVYYTPPEVARFILQRTLLDWTPPPATSRRLRILDPACGDGVFLEQAYRWLRGSHGFDEPIAADRDVRLVGWDRDPQALQACRDRLATVPGASGLCELRRTDTLLQKASEGGRFDAIVGNPPYVGVRRLAGREDADRRDQLRTRYQSARGAYDLYVLFLERALELLEPGGRCGMIVPNKLAGRQYATACRKWLGEQTTILELVDMSAARVFETPGVYPYILIWEKRKPVAGATFPVYRVSTTQQLAALHEHPKRDASKPFVVTHEGSDSAELVARVAQDQLSPQGWTLHGDWDVESRIATCRLADCAEIRSGTTGFQAQLVADALCEASAPGIQSPLESASTSLFGPAPCALRHDFVVSGNIDRYAIRIGQVRYMKRRYERPQLISTAPVLSPAKRRLFREDKIVVAGMTRRLEAAWDQQQHLALGVQVFAIQPTTVTPLFLLGLLNSKLLSGLYRLRFQSKQMSGGYLSIHKQPLSELPIPCLADSDRPRQRLAWRIARLASRLHRERDPVRFALLDRRLDRLVYALYGLTDSEQDDVESLIARTTGKPRR